MTTASKPTSSVAQFNFLNAADTKALANELKDFIRENKLTTTIQGKEFVQVEAWQYAGFRLGLTARVTQLTDLSTDTKLRYQAQCEIIHVESAQVVSAGYGFCDNQEQGKKFYQEYAIQGMAQTRSISRAYRHCIAFLIRLAGFEPTPAEEMDFSAASAPAAELAAAPTSMRALPAAQPEPVKAPAEPVKPAPEPVKPQPEPVKAQPEPVKPAPEPVKPQPQAEPVKAPAEPVKAQAEPVKAPAAVATAPAYDVTQDSLPVQLMRRWASVRAESPVLSVLEQKRMKERIVSLEPDKLEQVLTKLNALELETKAEVRTSIINYNTSVARRLVRDNRERLPLQWPAEIEDNLKRVLEEKRADDKFVLYLHELQRSIIAEAKLV